MECVSRVALGDSQRPCTGNQRETVRQVPLIITPYITAEFLCFPLRSLELPWTGDLGSQWELKNIIMVPPLMNQLLLSQWGPYATELVSTRKG